MKINVNSENMTFRMLYVLAIFMIIDGHLGSSDYLSLNNLLRYQNYHIALFVFASGYFLNLTRSYPDFLARKIKHLLVPLYLWNIFYGGLCWYLNTYQGFSLGGKFTAYNLFYAPMIDGHQFIYNMPTWFLFPLFLVQLISFVILKPFTENKTSPLLYFAFTLLLGCLALIYAPYNHAERNLMMLIYRVLYFLPFYAFGYLYKLYLEKYDKIKSPIYIPILLFLVYYLTLTNPEYGIVPSWLDYLGIHPLIIYLLAFLAILFWVRIARITAPILAQSPSLLYISRHTLAIMTHNFLGFMIIKGFFNLIQAQGFDTYRYKTDIWYNYFPNNNENIAIFYILITIVIALIIEFTQNKIHAKINSKFKL